MKEYYFLVAKDQQGPFSLEELKSKNLTSETLIWTEGMENWQKLKDLGELREKLNVKVLPPPPPIEGEEKTVKTLVSGQLKVTTEKSPNLSIEAIKPTNKALRNFLIWTGIHFFALITSYSQIEVFNDGDPKTEDFWPFVKIWEDHRYFQEDYSRRSPDGVSVVGKWEETVSFNGFFYRYDWSEFLVYVGGSILVFLIFRVPKDEGKSLQS